MLQLTLQLPLIICGDFSIDISDLLNSGWLGVPDFVPVWPKGVTSTLYNTSNRIIDYVLVSRCIFPLIGAIWPLWNTPWRPHLSFYLEILNRPMALQADFLVRPRPLPMEAAKGVEKANSDSVNQSLWECSQEQAAHTLEKARGKTGIAILGKPSEALPGDPKFGGECQGDSIKAGEALAFSTLSSEYYVFWLVGIPKEERHNYTGRCQYPKIFHKPITAPKIKDNRYLFPECDIVYRVTNRLSAIIKVNGDSMEHRLFVIEHFLSARDVIPCDLRDSLDELVNVYDLPFFLSGLPDTLIPLEELLNKAVGAMFGQKLCELNKAWRDFGRNRFQQTKIRAFCEYSQRAKSKG